MVKCFCLKSTFNLACSSVLYIRCWKGSKIYKNWTRNLGNNGGGDAAKSGKNTNLLVIMRTRLLQKIGLIDLENWTRFKKGNGYKICTKSVRDYWGMRVMIHTPFIYYWHKNVNLLGVCAKK